MRQPAAPPESIVLASTLKPRLVRRAQAASYLSLPISTFDALRSRGEIPPPVAVPAAHVEGERPRRATVPNERKHYAASGYHPSPLQQWTVRPVLCCWIYGQSRTRS